MIVLFHPVLGCCWEIGAAFYFGDSASGADACAFSRLMLEHDCKERHFLQKASSSVSPSTRESSISGSSLPVAVVPTQQSCGCWLTLGGPLSTGVLVGGSEVLHSFPCLHRVSPNAGGKGGFIFTVVFGHGKEVSCALGLYGLLVAGTVPGTWDVALVLPSWG